VSSKTKALPKFGSAFWILLFTCLPAGLPSRGEWERMTIGYKSKRKISYFLPYEGRK